MTEEGDQPSGNLGAEHVGGRPPPSSSGRPSGPRTGRKLLATDTPGPRRNAVSSRTHDSTRRTFESTSHELESNPGTSQAHHPEGGVDRQGGGVGLSEQQRQAAGVGLSEEAASSGLYEAICHLLDNEERHSEAGGVGLSETAGVGLDQPGALPAVRLLRNETAEAPEEGSGASSGDPLLSAVQRNDLEAARRAVREGRERKSLKDDELTGIGRVDALINAVKVGNTAIVKLLVHTGVDLELKIDGETALGSAVLWNQKEVVELLIEKGAKLETPNNEGQSPLHIAIMKDLADIVELLIKRGADVRAGPLGLSPLDLALRHNSAKSARLLLENGATVDEGKEYFAREFEDGEVASLYTACWLGDTEEVKNLIATGVDIEAASVTGETPLLLAVRNDSVKTAELLIKRGADLHAENSDGETPLYFSALRNRLGMLGVPLQELWERAGDEFETLDRSVRHVPFFQKELDRFKKIEERVRQLDPVGTSLTHFVAWRAAAGSYKAAFRFFNLANEKNEPDDFRVLKVSSCTLGVRGPLCPWTWYQEGSVSLLWQSLLKP
uniref:Uncharacterized protein n=1 Tax=Chromera velia CCMP2878 TaxID=1169474 RepID=A0A0K6S8X8_9ALVE|eukprot:Cvel_26760.t2-p1 / transcript=Cvel_26760.t2 / gene=Cvel_26760 / organism=Chromera_velia_CCMP2878 / gene_product=Ankyrin-3, putative / transcript_product=Ankyrin-3, putative / location=Cvel_scaffold3234:4450-8694(+) / protein_length=554 / sequence_SO=supercontig / SO=protein_coding / is_pseudo=false